MAGGARAGQPHRPSGQGNVTCATDRFGRVTCYGRVTRDGRIYRSKGVTVRTGVTLAAARRLAFEHLRALVRDLDNDRPPDPVRERTTLAEWVVLWGAAKRDALESPQSWPRYANLLDHHLLPHLGQLRLSAIRPAHVLGWRDWMRTPHGPRRRPASAVEIRAAETLLRQVLSAAAAAEHAVSEAVFKLDHVRARHATKPGFTAAQFLALLAAAEEPWRTMYVVAYYAMTRDGETRGLAWRHVLWATSQVDVAQQLDRSGTLRPPKQGSAGLVDVPAEAVEILERHRRRVEAALGRPVAPDDPVFTVRGAPIGYDAARAALGRDLARAGLPADLGWHGFRRGGATAHAAAAIDPLTLRQLMRHTDLDTTVSYLRPVVRGGQEAAERMAERVRRDDSPG